MRKKSHIRRTVLVVSYLAALAVVLGGAAWREYDRAESYRLTLEAAYQGALGGLVSSIDQINSSLMKCRYVTTPTMTAALSNEVTRQSALAAASMAALPFSNIQLEQTAKFISQTGDYSYSLSRKDSLDQQDRDMIAQLSATASQLSASLNQLYSRCLTEQIPVLSAAGQALSTDQTAAGQLSDSVQQIETDFPEYAGLIYDGPFSEHISRMEPLFLEGTEQVSMEQARAHLAQALGIEEGSITFDGETAGSLPCWSFSSATETGTFYADITKQGGYILYMTGSDGVNSAVLTAGECVEYARAFMAEAGFENMSESYYVTQNNIVTVNFAAVQSGAVCYPDLIKVSVSQQDGHITGFESRGYIMSHRQRQLPEIAVTQEAAEAAVSSQLTVESGRLALIPSSGKLEKLCHEFKCIDESGQRYLLYVNAATGQEEQILILFEDDNGVLTV